MADLLGLQDGIPPTALLVLYLSEEMGLEPVLPEVYTVLGEDATVDFLRIFGGRTIRVPSVLEVKEAYLAVQMHRELMALKAAKTVKESVVRIAEKYDVPPKDVVDRCRRVRKMLRELQNGVTDG